MSEIEKSQIMLDIEILINRSKCGGENFFTDSKGAASEIIAYLQQRNLIAGAEAKIKTEE